MSKASDKSTADMVSLRDTVESIWIAIVLAFVLRAFVVEAFVIPTGSMAPRLYGEHWQLTCPACRREYAFGYIGPLHGADKAQGVPANAHCPSCGFAHPAYGQPVRSGDRVLVMKYLYRFAKPQPWDVVVFRNPQDNRENYIKRLIGLPGESIEIVHGDIYVKNNGGEWHIRRKPHKAQQAMWQVVFDNDYQPDRSMFKGRRPPPQWRAKDSQWKLEADFGRRFDFAGSDQPAAVELFAPTEHFLPNYGYNPPVSMSDHVNTNIDICGDLRLSAVYEPQGQGSLQMEMDSLGHSLRATIASDGTCTLQWRGRDQEQWQSRQARMSPLGPGQKYLVELANVDASASLWVDGQEIVSVADDYPETYQSIKRRLEELERQRELFETPRVRFVASGGPCSLTHVRVDRDVYYTNPSLDASIPPGPLHDYAQEVLGDSAQRRGRATRGQPITLADREDDDLDEFFLLGDNSPQSLDGRQWLAAAPTLRLRDESGQPLYQLGTVPRYSLIGKAFFVYWPAAYQLTDNGKLPIIPNVGKMRLID